MLPFPVAEPLESNAFETIAKLTLSQNQRDLPNNNQTQTIYSNSVLTNDNTCNPSQNNKVYSHDQSTVILQQFSMITKELKLSQSVQWHY